MEKPRKSNRKPVRITKRYTVRYIYAGISQYVDFSERSDGKISNQFHPKWVRDRSEIPNTSKLNSIESLLSAVKEFAKGKAWIHLIDGQPISYYENQSAKKDISAIDQRYDRFLKNEAVVFFEEHLLPIMKNNEWLLGRSHIGMPILIKEYDGKFENVREKEKELEFNYLCQKFLVIFNRGGNVVLQPENGKPYIAKSCYKFFNLLPDKYLRSNNLIHKEYY